MDEVGWIQGGEFDQMLRFIRRRITERKLRLFAIAFVRQHWDMLEANAKDAVGVVEDYIEGPGDARRLQHARKLAKYDYDHVDNSTSELVLWAAAQRNLAGAILRFATWDVESDMSWAKEVLRDIAGNPFRPTTLDASIRTPLIQGLAHAAYDARQVPSGKLDPERLTVLADALEDAVCTDADLLGHLRGPGPHVRGCFAVDLCLGRI